MINRLYVIYDRIADDSSGVFEAKNDGVALRGFAREMAKVDNPGDFKLLCVGVLDHGVNAITPVVPAEEIFMTLRTGEEVLNEQGV